MEPEIYNNQEALQGVKEGSRGNYSKQWQLFLDFSKDPNMYEDRMPTEKEMIDYFNHLRLTLNRASSTLWNIYSILNSVIKGKYGKKLQIYTRLTSIIKSYDIDTKKKAKIFTYEEFEKFIETGMDDPYWLVRKVLVIISYFGGLRLTEAMNIKLEKIVCKDDIMTVKHERAKQRSDKKETGFLIPGKFSKIVEKYMNAIKEEIGKVEGRVFWTGRGNKFINQPLGKNSVSNVGHDVAVLLNLDSPESYTFHSFRRSSVTRAADNGATAQQLTDFYGWKSASMANEYISTSKSALQTMASKLGCSEKLNVSDNKQEKTSDVPIPNFDLGEPDMTDLQQSHYRLSENFMAFPNASKVVIVQKIENFNM